MKTIVLLRHGHAAEAANDHARELTPAGQAAAQASAAELKQRGFAPAVVLSSTATRALRTAEIAAEELGFLGAIEKRGDLYLAEPDQYCQALQELSDDTDSVLLVAHNPGLEDLARRFGHHGGLAPAAYAWLQSDNSHWREFCS
jgi:phosphohistidine phosphatase